MNESSDFGESNLTCNRWLDEEIPNHNVTLDYINSQLVRRNIGGISFVSAIAIIGLVGNLHVLYIYLKQFKTSNYKVYVVYLAIMDLIHCAVVAPLLIMYLFYPVTYPSASLCKTFRYIQYVMAVASSSSLVAIAIDRYKKICSPLGPQLTTRNAKMLCFLSFLFSVIVSIPAPVLFGLSTTQTGIPGLTGFRCFTEDRIKLTKFQFLFNIGLGTYFVAVLTCLIFVYIRIGRHIFHHKRFQSSMRRMSARSEQEVKLATGSGAKKSTITLCFVTVAYFVSALPHHLLALVIFVVKDFDCNMTLLQSQFYYTFVWSYLFNSVVNPFIYGIRDRKFRFEVRNIYRR